MTGEDVNLSRRKLLGVLGTVGGASAGAGVGTSAFFSDLESFENNSLVAGSLDIKAEFSAHYSDWSADEDGSTTATTDDDVAVRMYDGPAGTTGDATDLEDEETGLPANDAWLIAVDDPEQFLANTQTAAKGDAACPDGTDADDLEQPMIDLEDVKPGDFGEMTIDFAICDNPGFVWLNGELISATENGTTEPESDDPDEDGDADSTDPADVELLDVVQAAVWVNDGDNYQDGEELLVVGSLDEILNQFPASGQPTSAAGNAGNVGNAELVGDIPAEEGGGRGRNCFSAETTHSVAFAWWVPTDHGNEIQTDTARFDLGLYAEQCRHNRVTETDEPDGMESYRKIPSDETPTAPISGVATQIAYHPDGSRAIFTTGVFDESFELYVADAVDGPDDTSENIWQLTDSSAPVLAPVFLEDDRIRYSRNLTRYERRLPPSNEVYESEIIEEGSLAGLNSL